MSKSVNVGYTDTPISGVTSLALTRGLVNYKADWRVKATAANELMLVNLTSPVDRPEKMRVAYSDVANIYQGTDVDPSVFAPSKRGVSVLCQLTETFSVSDSADPSFRVDLPISMHLVVKVPASEYLTSDQIQASLGRLVSGLYDTGSLTTTRIQAMLRGSLKPSDL